MCLFFVGIWVFLQGPSLWLYSNDIKHGCLLY
uniref:Uncharacterized protein n=1 Tax=Anguilla anguilla TaxID=7936 RepID=A0A0E9T7W4_ANGAN